VKAIATRWFLAVLVGGLVSLPLRLSADEPREATPAPLTELMPTVQAVAAQAKPSVCVVAFEGRDGTRQGLGTGFVIDPKGIIATNLHVIGEARPIEVQLADGRKFSVSAVLATDRDHDLALLKIDADGLPALPLGDSDALQDGESILALGNPLGLERSVVAGVLSGRRSVEGRPMLQIALPIERGNSGGPVLDMQGRVQGIVTLKSQRTENLGFAVPVNLLKPLSERPNPVPMPQWLTIGVLDSDKWSLVGGGRWRQRSGRISVEELGSGFGGRCLCLSTLPIPDGSWEVSVDVKFEPEDGAAGLVIHSDGQDRHYGFYPSNGQLRFSRFDGPDVYSWTVLAELPSRQYRPLDWNTLKVRVEAGVMRCSINGEPVIESRDTVYQSGRVGLCKFRQTRAEFRQFRLGTELPDVKLSAKNDELLRGALTQLPQPDDRGAELIESLAQEAPAAMAMLEAESRRLEQQAEQVRRLASAVHEQSVLAEMTRLVERPDAEIDLTRSALVLARMDNPDLDVEAYADEVSQLAAQIRRQLPEHATDAEKLQAIRSELFERRGFHGSRHDYDNPANSYLNDVLDDREGLPITLAVLFMEVARHVETPVVGLALPGQFMVRHMPSDGPGAILDVFEGGETRTVDEVKAKVATLSDDPWDDRFLEPAPRRMILTRMLRNLFAGARERQEFDRMLRYAHLLVVLQPDSTMDRFFRAALLLQVGQWAAAERDALWLTEHPSEDLAPQAVEELMAAIRRARERGAPQ
jgi:serine protease Do